MQVPLVMTIIGRDRPGLVESVASIVAGHGGNWLQSRMCRLGGEFAGILQIEVDSGRQPALEQELKKLQAHGLTVVVYGTDNGQTMPSGKMARLELVGQDR